MNPKDTPPLNLSDPRFDFAAEVQGFRLRLRKRFLRAVHEAGARPLSDEELEMISAAGQAESKTKRDANL